MPTTRRRVLIGIIVFALVAWRAWPIAAAASGSYLREAVIATSLSEFFLPPARRPDKIRSGMAHPGFEFPKFPAQVVFCPQSVRHGYAFWCNDPALPADKAVQPAEILVSAETYEPWFGEKGCGGLAARLTNR